MGQVTDTSLTLTRVFKATPEELWDIWTDPAKVNQWHRQTKEGLTKSKADVRVDGSYEIAMTEGGGTFVVGGVFKELDPPRRMVYTWDWQDGSEHSKVTVEFRAVDQGTEVVLTHERLSNRQSVEAHEAGWIGCFNNIDNLISK